MSLPILAIDFNDLDTRSAHDPLVTLVTEATESDSSASEELDWKIERLALDLYGIPEEQRPRIWNKLHKLQRLRIIRELFPEEAESEAIAAE